MKRDPSMEPLLTISDAAKRVGVSYMDVEDAMDEGLLTYYTLGARGVLLRLDRRDVDEFFPRKTS